MGGCLRRRLCIGGTRTLPFVRRFTPREIEAATKGFTAVLEAGGPRGGGGTAYRARFAGGLVATVRRVGSRGDHRQQGSGGNGKAAFYLELQLLARLNHRHVVRLRGFAEGHHARFLVFDHMENRSLKECLHGNAAVTFQADSSSSEIHRLHGEHRCFFFGRSSQDAIGLADQAAGRH
ncbi:hypothetical protein PAHAL_2G031200 [Panicum hallii]|uniref:Uncharacterized protein n=1 Tax=Panicum hallii TaxID=206008 RepID=A0A2T8KMQ8_9POAL|nr:hypothetical protein PAHAL_2G031200 [Panicum hallii]